MWKRAEHVQATSSAAGRPTAPGATCPTRRAGSWTPTTAWSSSRTSGTISDKYPDIPPVVATHKGFSLPGFDQRGAAPRDVGPGRQGQPGRAVHDLPLGLRHLRERRARRAARPKARTRATTRWTRPHRSVNSFIKSLRENDYDASRTSSSPARRSATCRTSGPSSARSGASTSATPNAGAHLLGKLITHVGPKRIAWGTDSLWYGSPHREIVALRKLQFTDEAKELYNLPYGLDGDVEDPTQPAPDRPRGRSATGSSAVTPPLAYNIDPDAQRAKLDCDDVNGIAQVRLRRGLRRRAHGDARRCARTRCTARVRGATS